MQRREFIASTAGLAAAVVVGGVPALAGTPGPITKTVIVGASPAIERLVNGATNIWRERLADGMWRVHGLCRNEDGKFDDVVVSETFDERSSMLTCQIWAAWREELTGEEIGTLDQSAVARILSGGYTHMEHWLPKRFIA